MVNFFLNIFDINDLFINIFRILLDFYSNINFVNRREI